MYNLHRLYDADTVAAYEETIKSSHTHSTRILILDSNLQVREELSGLLSGSVEVNQDNRPHRRLNISLYRPKTSFQVYDWWFTDNWQVWYDVYCANIGQTIGVPIFAGKLAPGAAGLKKRKTDSSIVDVTAIGYEARYATPLGRPRRIPKGWKNTYAIGNILDYYDNLCGHARSNKAFESSVTRLAKDWYYGSRLLGDRKPQSTWAAVKLLAAGCGGWSIFVDGEFRIVLKPPSRSPVATFSVEKKNILKAPVAEIRFDSFVQGIVVHGATPEGQQRIRGEAWSHYPYRVQDLKERWVEEIDEPSAGTAAAAKSLAASRLADRQRIEMDIEIDALVDPRLQEYDWIQVSYGSENYVVPATSFDIPLVDGGTQAISSSRKSAAERVFAARRRRLRRAS